MEKTRRNQVLDATRGVASIFVVFCHFPMHRDYESYVVAIARFAVPFFLMLSGYYSNKSNCDRNIIHAKRKLADTLKLTVYGAAISAVANSCGSYFAGKHPFQWIFNLMNRQVLLEFFVFNRAYWLNSVMYYLFILIYTYSIFIVFNYLSLINIALFSPLLLIVNIIVSKICTPEHWYYSGNFLLTGFPFFMLGYALHSLKYNVNPAWLVWGIVFGIALTMFENYLKSGCYCYLGTIILSVSIFLLGINTKCYNLPGWLSGFGMRYSLFIFLLHCPIGLTINTIAKKMGISLDFWLPFVVIFVTVVCSFCFISLCRLAGKGKDRIH